MSRLPGSGRRRRTTRDDLRVLLQAARRPTPPAVHVISLSATEDAVAPRRRVATRRELRALLRVAGARASASPTPEFVALSDPARWRTPALVLDPTQPRDRRSSRPVLLSGAAAAALTVVLVGALTGVVGGTSAEADLELDTAIDTVVVLPDGHTVHGSRGLALPDGALVRTGPHGHAVAGDVELGPGVEAVVDGVELAVPAGRRVAAAAAASPEAAGPGAAGDLAAPPTQKSAGPGTPAGVVAPDLAGDAAADAVADAGSVIEAPAPTAAPGTASDVTPESAPSLILPGTRLRLHEVLPQH